MKLNSSLLLLIENIIYALKFMNVLSIILNIKILNIIKGANALVL